MSFWEYIISGVLITVIAGIILFFTLAALEGPRKKFLALVRKRPIVKTRKYRFLSLLEEIERPLLTINQLPSFPDTPIKEIRNALYEIRDKARQINSKEYRGIKKKLISYSEKGGKLHANISLREMKKLLVDDGAFKLVEEIREIIEREVAKK